MNITITKFRGQCYDGTSSMSGCQSGVSGVASVLQSKAPRAVYMYCYGHPLNLACSDVVKSCKIMIDALDTSHELIKLVKKSSRHDLLLQNLKEQMPNNTPGI